jgi:Domain of unknown function (DUF932)
MSHYPTCLTVNDHVDQNPILIRNFGYKIGNRTDEMTHQSNRTLQIASEQTPLTLTELMPRARMCDAEFSIVDSVPIERLAVTENALTFGTNSFAMDQNARSRLFTKASAPAAYLSGRSIDVQSLALQEHLRQGDFGNNPKIVVRNDQVFTIVSGTLIRLSHAELLSAVMDALGRFADTLSVSRIDLRDGRLELELLSPIKALEIRRDDVVKAGLYISHSQYGDQATQIQAFIYRLVCENGMMRRECVSSEGIVRTRRLPVDFPNGRELLLDQVRRLTTRTWDSLEPQLQELRASAERRTDVKQLLKQWLQRARISTRVSEGADDQTARTLMDRLHTAWRDEGSENTYWAAVNALTRVGTHDLELSPRQRRVLTLLAGLLAFSAAHLCPRCFSVLSEHSHEGESAAASYSQQK